MQNKNYRKSLILSLLMIMLLGILLYAYQRYERYLPAQPTASVAASLDAEQIAKIKTTTPITEIRVYKAERQLQLLSQDQVIRRYDMRLGFAPEGHKQQEGDGKTPEGRYSIDWRNSKSAFYKSLHISYPNAQDQAHAKQLGVSAGGDIMIHGSANASTAQLPNMMQYMPRNDWTLGCIAVRNVDMDEIWQLVENGVPIDIYP